MRKNIQTNLQQWKVSMKDWDTEYTGPFWYSDETILAKDHYSAAIKYLAKRKWWQYKGHKRTKITNNIHYYRFYLDEDESYAELIKIESL